MRGLRGRFTGLAVAIGIVMLVPVMVLSQTHYGLMVGIDNYDPAYGPSALASCINDANGMRECLLNDSVRWSSGNVYTRTDSAATKTMIRSSLSSLASVAVAGDVVVYYHSSHGGQNSGTSTFLCAYDASYQDFELAADLSQFRTGVTIIIIVDACNSGGLMKRATAPSGTSGDASKAAAQPAWDFAANVMRELEAVKATSAKYSASKAASIGWITASDYDETSLAGDPTSNFTGYLLSGFFYGDASANQEISFQELFNYADPKARADYATATPQVLNTSVLSATVATRAPDGVALATAADSSGLSWTTGGDASWTGQDLVAYANGDALMSGDIADSESCWVQTTVDGPGRITYRSKVWSETEYDLFTFSINGVQQGTPISGTADWTQYSVDITTSGTKTLRWTYSKDELYSRGADCSWLDQVVWFPEGTTLDTRRPEFSWTAVSGATYYQLWIQRNGIKYQAPWVQGTTTWTPGANGLPGGSYQWWVRGWGPQIGYGSWVPGNLFNILTQTPSALNLIAPDGAQADGDLVFRWDLDQNATWYRLWVGHPAGGTWLGQWVSMAGTGEGQGRVSGHPGGTSTWWMRAWGPDGYGPWTGPKEFTTPTVAPAVPTLIAPGGTVTSPVTFQYESARAEWYRVYVLNATGGVYSQWTQSTTHGPLNIPAGNYRWWVAAWNAASGETVWSERGIFYVQ